MPESMVEHKIIISESSRNLRSLGRNALEGRWKTAIIATCIYLLLVEIPPIVLNAIFGTSLGSIFTNSGYTYGLGVEEYAQLINTTPDYCFLSSVYVLLVLGSANLGLAMFYLAVFRRHDVKKTDVFLGFEKFGKALGLYLFQNLFIFLWSLLFVIPGIIAAIRYSQVFYVLADDPTKSIRECMNESKSMMRGNKGKYFCLSLSFIGWGVLCAIPSAILENIGKTISDNDAVIAIFSTVGGLCIVPLIVYMYSTFAGFYEILAGHLIKETIPVPVTPEEAKAVFEELNISTDGDEAGSKSDSEAPDTAGTEESGTEAGDESGANAGNEPDANAGDEPDAKEVSEER